MTFAEHLLTWLGLSLFGLLLWQFLNKKPERDPNLIDLSERRKRACLKAAQQVISK